MIRNGDNSIRESLKSDVLQEIQRILLSYEERIAVLEKENRLLWEENTKLCSDLEDLSLSIDAFEEEIKAKVNDALSNLAEA
jgi:predicted nuclease with TOPRIM domain